MTFDPVLSAMMAEQWEQQRLPGICDLCDGELWIFSTEDIRRVVGELHYIFDFKTLEEAKHHYETGSY